MFLVFIVIFCLFLLFPILTTPFLLFPIMYRFKYSRYYLWLFVLGISLIALRYIPNFTDDAAFHYKAAYIYHYYDNVFEWFGNLMTKKIPTEYGYHNYPLFALLLFLFSKTGTYSLISFTVCIIVYYMYTSIVHDIYNKYKISKFLFLFALITIVTIVNVRYTTSGMRYSLSVAITVFLFYREIENEFKLNKFLLWYVIPILIHSSAVIFLFIRILFPWLKNTNFYKKIMVLCILPLLMILSPVLQYLNIDYLSFLLDKFSIYRDTQTFIGLFRNSDLIYVYVGVLICIIYILFYHFVFRLQQQSKFKNFYSFVLYICLITISVLPFLTILDRFVWFVYPLAIISLVLHVTEDKSGSKKVRYRKNKYFMCYLVLFLCLFGGIIGNKKFLDFLNFVDFNTIEILTSNVFDYFSDLHHFSLSEVRRR